MTLQALVKNMPSSNTFISLVLKKWQDHDKAHHVNDQLNNLSLHDYKCFLKKSATRDHATSWVSAPVLLNPPAGSASCFSCSIKTFHKRRNWPNNGHTSYVSKGHGVLFINPCPEPQSSHRATCSHKSTHRHRCTRTVRLDILPSLTAPWPAWQWLGQRNLNQWSNINQIILGC